MIETQYYSIKGEYQAVFIPAYRVLSSLLFAPTPGNSRVEVDMFYTTVGKLLWAKRKPILSYISVYFQYN